MLSKYKENLALILTKQEQAQTQNETEEDNGKELGTETEKNQILPISVK